MNIKKTLICEKVGWFVVFFDFFKHYWETDIVKDDMEERLAVPLC